MGSSILDTTTLLQELLSSIYNNSLDQIHDCDGVDLDKLLTNPGELLQLADEKLHVFPFRDVGMGWLRLFTDASIGKALKLVRMAAEPTSGP